MRHDAPLREDARLHRGSLGHLRFVSQRRQPFRFSPRVRFMKNRRREQRVVDLFGIDRLLGTPEIPE